MFVDVKDLGSMQEALQEDKMAVLVFTTNDCGVCHVVKDKVGALMADLNPEAKLYHVALGQVPEASGAYMVFSAPVVLAYLEGKEVAREAGIISIGDLGGKLERVFGL